MKIRIHLTVYEYALLNKLTRQTNTDYWFYLDRDKEGCDCVRDLEQGYKITLRFAVKLLNEAIVPELIHLTAEELKCYDGLMEKLHLPNVLRATQQND